LIKDFELIVFMENDKNKCFLLLNKKTQYRYSQQYELKTRDGDVMYSRLVFGFVNNTILSMTSTGMLLKLRIV